MSGLPQASRSSLTLLQLPGPTFQEENDKTGRQKHVCLKAVLCTIYFASNWISWKLPYFSVQAFARVITPWWFSTIASGFRRGTLLKTATSLALPRGCKCKNPSGYVVDPWCKQQNEKRILIKHTWWIVSWLYFKLSTCQHDLYLLSDHMGPFLYEEYKWRQSLLREISAHDGHTSPPRWIHLQDREAQLQPSHCNLPPALLLSQPFAFL